MIVPMYPTLFDRGDSVSLGLVDSRVRAEAEIRRAVRRLFVLATQRDLHAQLAQFPKRNEMRLWSASISGFELDRQLADVIAARALSSEKSVPRSAETFNQQHQAGRARIGLAVQDVARLVPSILAGYHQARRCAAKWDGTRWQYAADDVQDQLNHLIGSEFLTETPWCWLQQFPRYLKAIEYRLDKLGSGAAARDRTGWKEIQHWWRLYRDFVEQHPSSVQSKAALNDFRWMIEEYRVSLFAQPLGTALRVSNKRLERQWQTIENA